MADDYGVTRRLPENYQLSDDDFGGVQFQDLDATFKELDRFLPIANVTRIMKKVLPLNTKISKDAKETMQLCVSEFVSLITGEASDKCQREKRRAITGDDLLWALRMLSFDDYVKPLETYLKKYQQAVEGRGGNRSGRKESNHSNKKGLDLQACQME